MVQYKIFDDFKGELSYAILPREIDPKDGKKIQTFMKSENTPVFFERQLHGTESRIIKNPVDSSQNLEGDILITQEKQTPLVIRIADCASVMLFDPAKKIIANIHAGWRGISARAISKTITQLVQQFKCNPEDILASISPMIGPCCSKFSDPENELPKFMQKYVNEENFVDLWAAVEGQLKEAGIKKSHIENPRICTFCNPEEYPSFRRDKDASGRFGTAIMLK